MPRKSPPETTPARTNRPRRGVRSSQIVSSRLPNTGSGPGLWWRLSLIVFLGFLAYWNSLSGPFVFDDEVSIVTNSSIREWWNLTKIFARQLDTPVAGRPLVNFTFALNFAFGGLSVSGYHLWSVFTHLACALLVFGVVRRTLELPAFEAGLGRRSVDLAFATALVWALHPLNTEAVDYLTQRSETMMALFYLLTVYGSIRATRRDRARGWQAIAVLSCALGMACKESMVTAPLMVLLYDRIFVYDSLKGTLRARWDFYGGLALTWTISAALILPGPRAHSAGFWSGVDPWTYLLNQTIMIARYLRLSLWPKGLVLNYGWPVPLTLPDVVPYALLVVLLVLLTVSALILRPGLGFLGAWFFVTLAPTSSFVPIATEVGAERRMYLPLIALVALAVIGGSRVLDGLRHTSSGRSAPVATPFARLGGTFVLVVVSAALAAGTIARNREYASGLSLARTTLARWPSGFAHHMVGSELAFLGRDDEAIPHMREAIRTYPSGRYNLGVALFNTGKLDEAIEQFQTFVRQEPWLLEVVSARSILGQAFMIKERWPEATEQFRLVLTMVPSNIQARRLLADALSRQQAFEEATLHYREYLAARPRDTVALSGLGVALASSGRLDEAISTFRQAVALEPQSPRAHFNLGTALLDHDEADAARAEAERAVALSPNDADAYDLLGRSLAVQGKLDEAIAQFERSLRIDPNHAAAHHDLTEVLRARRSRPGFLP